MENRIHRPLWPIWLKRPEPYDEPDWAAVAEHYDVIHLTQLGYITCAYAPIPCLDGHTSVCGWGPDYACWLTYPDDPTVQGTPPTSARAKLRREHVPSIIQQIRGIIRAVGR
ncbi:MAG: hypothetical protein LBV00_05455 [Propionibacteriaceae bacterium]|nr:hypothetical protein [Propionibacteriaceae bacterium]